MKHKQINGMLFFSLISPMTLENLVPDWCSNIFWDKQNLRFPAFEDAIEVACET